MSQTPKNQTTQSTMKKSTEEFKQDIHHEHDDKTCPGCEHELDNDNTHRDIDGNYYYDCYKNDDIENIIKYKDEYSPEFEYNPQYHYDPEDDYNPDYDPAFCSDDSESENSETIYIEGIGDVYRDNYTTDEILLLSDLILKGEISNKFLKIRQRPSHMCCVDGEMIHINIKKVMDLEKIRREKLLKEHNCVIGNELNKEYAIGLITDNVIEEFINSMDDKIENEKIISEYSLTIDIHDRDYIKELLRFNNYEIKPCVDILVKEECEFIKKFKK